MRITKQLAENIARQLLSKKVKEIEEIEQKMSRITTEYYESTIPIPVLNLAKKHKGWVRMTDVVKLNNGFFRYYGIKLTKTLPKLDTYSEVISDLDPKFNKEIQALYNKKKELTERGIELKNETISTLIALGTYKRVAEVFPEAARLLPDEGKVTSKALTVNVELLRKRISS